MVKSSSTVPYCFVSGQSDKFKSSRASKYVLNIRQQPVKAKVCGPKERDRRPIDPPPIVQIKLSDPASDKNKDYLQSPYLFMCCNLVHDSDPTGEIVAPAHRALAGTVVSSLNRLKDIDNSDGGFFVFGDMSVRMEGRFRLRFTLFELIEGQVVHVMTTISNTLTVYTGKNFPGMSESTFLSRSFSDQGVRIRIRKDHHVKPKGPAYDDATHSPPSSCHEADMSDNEMTITAQPRKRAKSTSVNESSEQLTTTTPAETKKSHSTSPDQVDRSPPSSPGSHIGQDSIPSRPHHDPYMWDMYMQENPYLHHPRHPSRYSDPRYRGHPDSRRYRHEYLEYPPYDPTLPSQPREIPHRERGYPPTHPGYKVKSRLHDPSSRYPSSYHYYHAHEHGYPYPEIYPAPYHDHPPHPMSSSHPFPAPVHSLRHPHLRSPPHPMLVPRKGREPAMHHGFPDGPREKDTTYTPEPYHSRTPSMSSQHSEGNFSPPRPFSPTESHSPSHAGSSGETPPMNQERSSQSPALPPSAVSSSSGVGSRIQLPPIHNLSTHSPIILAHPLATPPAPGLNAFP